MKFKLCKDKAFYLSMACNQHDYNQPNYFHLTTSSHLFFLVQRETEGVSSQGWKVIYFISNMDTIYILEPPVTANHIQ